jgi:hypothetical protein
MLIRLILTALLSVSAIGAGVAAPSRIIILRHGEKANVWRLCGVGQQRADALAANYLGRDAAKSLFASGDEPAAFLAITLHTLELASPAATTWGKPIMLYSVVPEADISKKEVTEVLNRRTEEAVRDVMVNPLLLGKTVVMVWEHKHIADVKLEAKFPGKAVTLRQLLKLDQLNDVPESWPSGTYDYFWIVDYGNPGTDVPTGFSMVKQEFGAPFETVPANDWDKPNDLTPASGCDLKGAAQ